ncbi:hypothetical protein SUGI_0630030 [Cryptomeria japonica]|uniref:uncharacterized protein LOC131054609 n=1 Tax=Cryptomeria japonica TaxID=3369 RepID=UPI002414CF56|nr:uncharacterized protein LOC131054609 [Cryptomeria japonica]GLJ31401.1 hypothetical protein SUGI_0630030 [Cryptomeria japonica]
MISLILVILHARSATEKIGVRIASPAKYSSNCLHTTKLKGLQRQAMVKDLSLKSRDASARLMLRKEHGRHKFGEVVGGTIADCGAVVCCPCALLSLVVVKLLVGLSRKAWRKIRGKRKSVQGEELFFEDPVTSSQYELLTPKHSVNVLVMDHNFVSTEKIWENVAGKSHVGFWRNDF